MRVIGGGGAKEISWACVTPLIQIFSRSNPTSEAAEKKIYTLTKKEIVTGWRRINDVNLPVPIVTAKTKNKKTFIYVFND